MAKQAVSFTLNGKAVDVLVEPRELLIHTLRENLNHTGAHIGCVRTIKYTSLLLLSHHNKGGLAPILFIMLTT